MLHKARAPCHPPFVFLKKKLESLRTTNTNISFCAHITCEHTKDVMPQDGIYLTARRPKYSTVQGLFERSLKG